MSKIVWDDSLSVKIKEIDEQHQRWISIINELHDCLMDGRGLTDIARKSLKAMEDYGLFHFDFEEKYMEKIGYPELEQHKREHAVFLRQIQKVIQQEKNGELLLNTTVMKMLMNWLTDHIVACDKKYSKYRS